MANPVQWTVDAFYGELTKLRQTAQEEARHLDTQKLTLQNAYAIARNGGNASAMKFLDPLIHKNSELRLKYRDLVARFNKLASDTAGLVKKTGLTPPSGLGVVPIVVVSAAAVAALLILWGLVRELQSGRAAITRALESDAPLLLAVATDPGKPPAERAAAMASYNDILKQAGAANAGGGLLGDLTPILGLAAVILIAPPLLQQFGRRS